MAVRRFQTHIEFAPLTIPAASQRPLGLRTMVPFPVFDAEQYFFQTNPTRQNHRWCK
jgi:hypothetical protein